MVGYAKASVFAALLCLCALALGAGRAQAAGVQACGAKSYRLALRSLTGPPRAGLTLRVIARKSGCELPGTLARIQVTIGKRRKLAFQNVPSPGGLAAVVSAAIEAGSLQQVGAAVEAVPGRPPAWRIQAEALEQLAPLDVGQLADATAVQVEQVEEERGERHVRPLPCDIDLAAGPAGGEITVGARALRPRAVARGPGHRPAERGRRRLLSGRRAVRATRPAAPRAIA